MRVRYQLQTLPAMIGLSLLLGCAQSQEKPEAAGESHVGHVDEYSAPDAEPGGLKPQTTCPVMGKKIVSSIHVDHDGKRVYLCCEGCRAEFKKNPGKYLKKLADLGEKRESVSGS